MNENIKLMLTAERAINEVLKAVSEIVKTINDIDERLTALEDAFTEPEQIELPLEVEASEAVPELNGRWLLPQTRLWVWKDGVYEGSYSRDEAVKKYGVVISSIRNSIVEDREVRKNGKKSSPALKFELAPMREVEHDEV